MDAINQTLGDIARSNPVATRVFLRHRLDFCCRGHRTLDEACRTSGLDAADIAREIEGETARTGSVASWADRPLAELADHIEHHYHERLRRDVPALITAARRVERVHAGKPAVPTGLASLLEAFWQELEHHMMKEEKILFPMLRQGALGASVYAPVKVMQHEHDEHGVVLAEVRARTGNLTIPPGACATWTALYRGLETLEAELMEHIHLENNILFTRAVLSS